MLHKIGLKFNKVGKISKIVKLEMVVASGVFWCLHKIGLKINNGVFAKLGCRTSGRLFPNTQDARQHISDVPFYLSKYFTVLDFHLTFNVFHKFGSTS